MDPTYPFIMIVLFCYTTTGDYQIPPNCVLTTDDCPNPNVTFFLYTRNTQADPYELSVTDPESIDKAMLIPNAPIVVLIHGYTGNKDYSPNPELRTAYFDNYDLNIISVDYRPLAKNPCYFTAVMNVPTIGKCSAQLLDEVMMKRNIPSNMIHVIGFSLGAQVSGAIGNNIQSGQIGRITGLDPAMPLFSNPNNKQKLDKDDAEFVDIIHTDALEKGKLEATGHVDFYLNGGRQQPGCTDQSNSTRSSCNHLRAVLYYAESINTDVGFYGVKCSSLLLYMLGWCYGKNVTDEMIMGEYTPNTARGLYFVTTNSEPPYARGHSSQQSDTSQARYSNMYADYYYYYNDIE